MAVVENPNRFSLPVETTIRQLLLEKHPKLNTAPGSAIYDLIITPAAIIQQQMRDRMRVIQRNQSIANFATMLPEEMDRLASNFFVTRRSGSKATGQQRVYFSTLQNVTISTSAQFTDETGLTFNPSQNVFVSAATLALNNVPETGEYYVDVPIVSEEVGENYRLKAGQIVRVSGISGASRTINLYDMSGGSYPESNSELYVRIKKSLASRDTVKADSIRSLILDNFPSIKDVIVQGYGDTLMTRDVASVVMSVDRMFEGSFAQKTNLPLNANGDVVWTDDSGEVIVAPIGGYVGAIYDLTGKDFNNLRISLDGRAYENISIQPGFKVRFLDDADSDSGKYFLVTKVEEVPVEPGGDPIKVIRLDRPLTSLTSASTAADGAEYTIYGHVNTNTFHIGGKVDVYIKSVEDQTKSVVIGSLPATHGDAICEVPLDSSFISETGQNYFEQGIGFDKPVITIVKVEEIDPVENDSVVRTLIPDVHYRVIRKEMRGRFTTAVSDVLRIEGTDTFAESGITIPTFTGARIKVTYVTNPDINLIQEYINLPTNRDITGDTLVLPPEVVQLNVTMSYKGSRSVNELSELVSRFIQSKGFAPTISVNELLTVLSYFGVTDVTLPVLFTAIKDNGDGTYTVTNSEDRIQLESTQVFKPVAQLAITKTA
jgi:hypothetical protein